MSIAEVVQEPPDAPSIKAGGFLDGECGRARYACSRLGGVMPAGLPCADNQLLGGGFPVADGVGFVVVWQERGSGLFVCEVVTTGKPWEGPDGEAPFNMYFDRSEDGEDLGKDGVEIAGEGLACVGSKVGNRLNSCRVRRLYCNEVKGCVIKKVLSLTNCQDEGTKICIVF
jgi:hypothetical protein